MASYGSLQVRVFTSRANLPLEDAAVIVTRPSQNGNPALLRFLLTDPGGNTVPFDVASPDEQASVSVGNAAPFSLVDVLVDQRDYDQVLIRDVQIFPGIVSVQDVRLTPTSLDQAGRRETIRISAQDL